MNVLGRNLEREREGDGNGNGFKTLEVKGYSKIFNCSERKEVLSTLLYQHNVDFFL